MSVVSLTRCETYDPAAIEGAIRKSIDLLGGISRFVRPGNAVLLKPNLLSASASERHITTHPEVVRAVARIVLEAGGKPTIGDSPAIESFRRVTEKTGMSEVAGDLGIEMRELNEPALVPQRDGMVFKKLEVSAQALKADVVINLPKLKTHSQMMLTLGVKNLFGTIVAQRKAEWHYMAGVDRDTFASLLLDIYLSVRPALTILDGVWGMEGHGPSNGKPRQLNMIAASEDAVALDMSICQMVGAPLHAFPLYRVARARGIGETDVRHIRFEGESPDRFQFKGFDIPRLDSLNLLPGVLSGLTQRYLVSKPVQKGAECIRCGKCSEVCPARCIELGAKGVIFDYDRCIRCYCCQEICPQDAIQFHKGLLVRVLNRFNR